ncbi:Neural Wiskott-Aldrich syndrome protein [Collichthys lucidus]|uniref:Neural Wiskott-Aldrich syndrome protein n=1 Tax=Collichthys lucidus TaxID=240159 RepID=A0A4U5VR34_COLLU|nr:Neural Wiskott-Aldrich syndrome protein [Collichthys lucidus]
MNAFSTTLAGNASVDYFLDLLRCKSPEYHQAPAFICATLSSAVVQVFTADRNSIWNKRCCGVACLVKDNPQRSYFIRVFDLRDGKITFEQELYSNFNIYLPKSYFMTFAGDTCQVGLNFASEEETKRFRSQVGELIGRRQRKTGTSLLPPLPTYLQTDLT